MAFSTLFHSGSQVMHLKNLNVYIEAAMHEWQKQQNITGIMPRQYSSLEMTDVRCCSGTSSFGMSGINSHMLLQAHHLVDDKRVRPPCFNGNIK